MSLIVCSFSSDIVDFYIVFSYKHDSTQLFMRILRSLSSPREMLRYIIASLFALAKVQFI